MNIISGKVVLKDNNIGIPDLLVEIYDVDPGTKPAETFAGAANPDGRAVAVPTTAVNVPHGIPADRIGSVLTDESGAFELKYEDDEFRIRNPNEPRPDLMIRVQAPEEPGAGQSRELYRSVLIRENAGRREGCIIWLKSADLAAIGIPIPTGVPESRDAVETITGRLLAAEGRYRSIVDDGVRIVQKRRVARVRETASVFDKTIRPELQKALSNVVGETTDLRSLVTPGESVTDKNVALIRDTIVNVINDPVRQRQAKTRRFVSLTQDEREAIRTQQNSDGSVAASAVSDVLARRSAPTGTVRELVREDPVLAICRPRSKKENELAAALGLSDADEAEHSNGGASPGAAGGNGSAPAADADEAGDGVEPLTAGDIERFAARLVGTMTTPEEEVVVNLEPRATGSAVAKNLEDLSLPPSPADAVAFYDFHSLQIAFEHVWQEVIDEGLLDLAEDAFHQIVERGGDPAAAQGGEGRNPIRAITDEGRRVLVAMRAEANDQAAMTYTSDGLQPSTLPPNTMARTIRDHRTPSGGGRSGSPTIRDHRTGTHGAWQPHGTVVHVPPTVTEDPLPDVLKELKRRAQAAYPFTVYAANTRERSVNFGVLTTYRQRWKPEAYQAGKLVKTATLAPKETRRYSKKTTTKRKRSEKEVQTHLRSRREEMSETSRAEQEIIRKAHVKTNFELTAVDTVKVPLTDTVQLDHTQTTSFKREAGRESQDLKRAFHEAVFKAAQEYKDETTTEVNVETSEEVEIMESGEITNPNDEIAVTFLFYELQRRYTVSERIYRLTPVILVAQEVPNPSEVDADWVLEHDWILAGRIILDDFFLPAIAYLSENVVGEEVALRQLKESVEQQRRVVEETKQELALVRDRLSAYRTIAEGGLFQRATGGRRTGGGGGGPLSAIPIVGDAVDALGDAASAVAGVAGDIGEFIFGDDSTNDQSSARKDALKEAIQRTADLERDLLFRLEREVTALNASTEGYAKALAQYYNHQTQIVRLFDHLTRNMLYYMQGIWTHEPPDQRFFRLHKVRVPVFETKAQTYRFVDTPTAAPPLAAMAHRRVSWLKGVHIDPEQVFEAEVSIELDPQMTFTTLAQVADLDNLLGFKGNYMIFPLRESNPLTDYMMAPYVVEGLDELIDPDGPGNWTLDEFAGYVSCLKKKLTAEQFAELREQLQQQYKQLVTTRLRDGEILNVPTGALFIEALPASHSLIERYKALHRAIDVKKVQAEVRRFELENLRYAARIVAGEREDPEIERKILIEGTSAVVVPPSDN